MVLSKTESNSMNMICYEMFCFVTTLALPNFFHRLKPFQFKVKRSKFIFLCNHVIFRNRFIAVRLYLSKAVWWANAPIATIAPSKRGLFSPKGFYQLRKNMTNSKIFQFTCLPSQVRLNECGHESRRIWRHKINFCQVRLWTTTP